MLLDEIKAQKEKFEANGRHCMGIHLTKEMAVKLRKELHHYYGKDPGMSLMTLFGVEVLSTNAAALKFEE